MQLEISLRPQGEARLPFSYYSLLSAALYSAMSKSNPEFAADLHGGPTHQSRIKLFGFTPLHSREMAVNGGGPGSHGKELANKHHLLFKGRTQFRIFSPAVDTLNALGEGLLSDAELRIGSQKLTIDAVQIAPPPKFAEEMIWRPWGTASIVSSRSIERGETGKERKIFLFPGAPNSEVSENAEQIVQSNIIHKWKRLRETWPSVAERFAHEDKALLNGGIDSAVVKIIVASDGKSSMVGADRSIRTKLHQIKNAPVRSWIGPVAVHAPIPIQRLIWSAGLGQMNSMGFGGVEAGPDNSIEIARRC